MAANPGFPLSLDVRGYPVLVLGGDEEAAELFRSYCPSTSTFRRPSERRSEPRAVGEATRSEHGQRAHGLHDLANDYRRPDLADVSSALGALRDDEVALWSQQIIKALESLGGTLRAHRAARLGPSATNSRSPQDDRAQKVIEGLNYGG